VPDDIVVEANSTDGAEVTYTTTAQDNVDKNAILEDDSGTVTRERVVLFVFVLVTCLIQVHQILCLNIY
jgi:hypothetical protein